MAPDPDRLARLVGRQERVLARRGLEVREPLVVHGRRQTYLVAEAPGTKTSVVKCYRDRSTEPYAFRVHRDVLPAVPRRQGRTQTPAILDTGLDEVLGWWVRMERLDGDDLRNHWSYRRPTTAGGRALDESVVDDHLDVLADLRRVPTETLVDRGLATGPRAADEPLAAIDRLAERGRLGPGPAADLLEALDLLRSAPLEGPPVVSNEDFRPSNVIRMDGGFIGLVDWDGARVSSEETEHCVAQLWLALFERSDLRARLLDGAAERFALDVDRVRLHALRGATIRAADFVDSGLGTRLREDLYDLLNGAI